MAALLRDERWRREPRAGARWKHLAGPLLVVAAFTLPAAALSDKAFHVDDPVFLRVAERVLERPADPYGFRMNWLGVSQPVSELNSNPPGMSYYLALAMALLGRGERALHLSLLPFLALLALAEFRLARRFGVSGVEAALLLLATPILLVTSQTLMPDLPVSALALASLAAFVTGHERGAPAWIALSGLCAAAALLVRYSGVLASALVGLYWLLFFRRERAWTLAALLPPALAFALWNLWSARLYGAPHFFAQLDVQLRGATESELAVLAHLLPLLAHLGGGGVFPLWLAASALTGTRRDGPILGGALAAAALALFAAMPRITGYVPYDALHGALVLLFLAGILALLARAVGECVTEWRAARRLPRETLFLLAWVAAVLALHARGIHTAAKYALPALPAVVFLALRGVRALTGSEPARRALVAAGIALTLATGLAVAWADHELAAMYRRMAAYAAAVHGREPGTLHFTGHWGWQHYLEQLGARAYEPGLDELRAGDVLVTCDLAWPQALPPALRRRLTLVEQQSFGHRPGLRTVHNHPGEPAHFYASYQFEPPDRLLYGVLPFSVTRADVETLRVYRVR
jgi:4-amino-4-deoxy-L-arabinose transferase-like glycosyltransferase